MDNVTEDQKTLLQNDYEGDGINKNEIIGQENNTSFFRRLRKTIIVEPLMIMYTMAWMQAYTLQAQFRYQRVAESMGIDLNNLTQNGTSQCDTSVNHSSYLLREQVQNEASNWNIYMQLVNYIPSIVLIMLYGSYSDKIGRKTIMILPFIGGMASSIIYICMILFDLPVTFFLLTAVESLFGGTKLLNVACFAYIADTTLPEKRAFRNTVLQAVLLLGAAIPQLGVGYWIKADGFLWPYVFVLVIFLICLLYVVFLVPPSKPTSQNTQKTNWEYMTQGIRICLKDDSSGRRWKINTILLSYVVSYLLTSYDVTILFQMNAPLCWKSVLIGYYEAASKTFRCIAMLIAAIIFKRYMKEEGQAIITHISITAEYTYMFFGTTTAMMFLAPFLGMFAYYTYPMYVTILSRLLQPDEQGAMFALMNTLHTMFYLVGDTTSNKIYAATLLYKEGLVFLIIAAVDVVSLGIFLVYVRAVWRERRLEKYVNDNQQTSVNC